MRNEKEAIAEAAKKLLLANRRTVAGHTFTIPSPYEYRHQWLWDSCFHAIVLRHFDINAAEGELKSLLASQHRDGMIPHESKYSLFGTLLPFTSRVTQPPFAARAAWDVYSKGKNKEFLKEIFPKLEAYHNWLRKHREEGNVLKVVESDESGEDNSVLWDDIYKIPIHKFTYLRWFATYVPMFPQWAIIKSAKATSIYADAVDCMAQISRAVGQLKAARAYDKRKRAITAAMRKLFRAEDGLLYSTTMRNKHITYKTNSIFAPLFSGTFTRKEAKTCVEDHLVNEKEFWTPYAIPTVSISERKFSAGGYWRGPMWININWMLHRGLLRYGFKTVAAELLEKTVAAVKKSGFREYYNPITGAGIGAKQFGWSTLVADMILDKQQGFK
ncbi:hypothetical protein HYU18_00920 [Candidatus Woesearchaeota archaeon]|nr:hypothetical protein [Candidatus Woesearchaeota archaeon]